MTGRAMWKGTIDFQDLRVPVKLFAAVENRNIGFRLFHEPDRMPLRQRMINPATEDEVKPAPIQTLSGHALKSLSVPDGAWIFSFRGRVPLGVRASLRLSGKPFALVPHHHGAPTVLPLRDGSFEGPVRQWVVLHLDYESANVRIQARPLRDGPALERSVHLQAEVVVEPPGRVLLYHKSEGGG